MSTTKSDQQISPLYNLPQNEATNDYKKSNLKEAGAQPTDYNEKESRPTIVKRESVDIPMNDIESSISSDTSSTVSNSIMKKVYMDSKTSRYVCPYPTCTKSFTRFEHLSRHKLNHWPKKIFECSYVYPDTKLKCTKTFVRRDLLRRHEKRHSNKEGRLSNTLRKHPTLRESQADQSIKSTQINNSSSTSSALNLNTLHTSTPKVNQKVIHQNNNISNGNNLTINPAKVNNNNNNNNNNSNDPQSFSQFFDWIFDNDIKNNHIPPGTNNTINKNTSDDVRSDGQPKNLRTLNNNGPKLELSMSSNGTALISDGCKPVLASPQTGSNIVEQSIIPPEISSLQSKQDIINDQDQPQSNPVIKEEPDLSPRNHFMSTTMGPAEHFQAQLQFPQPGNIPPRVQDLYSLDYLAADPLQNFMQELASINHSDLSRPDISTTNNPSIKENSNRGLTSIELEDIPTAATIPITDSNDVSNASSLLNTPGSLTTGTDLINFNNRTISNPTSQKGSTTSLSSTQLNSTAKKVKKTHTIIPKSQTSFIDSKRNSIRDNFLAQKSNISELKKQTYHTEELSNDGASSKSPPILKEHIQKNNSKKRKLLESMKDIPTIFYPDPKTKYKLSKEKCQELYNLIPELRYIPYNTLQISLKSFWQNFHPQYGLLHKPSFNVNLQPPILILALIMIGANYLGVTYRESISDPICGPLRWIIFSHPDFQPPSRTYIIHSLCLLESYEKASTNRYLHERSYLHHGTTIQLLRRTPSLGGHPLRDKTKQEELNEEGEEEEPNELNKVLTKWIEFESLKRVAFFAFYMDVTHAVVFGYMNLFISFRQIQLKLPCPDKIWESYELSFETLRESGFGSQEQDKYSNQTFLSSLKNLIREVISTMRVNSSSDLSLLNKSTLSNMMNDSTYTINHLDKYNNNNFDRVRENKDNNMETKEPSNLPIRSLFGKKLMLAGLLSVMFQCQEENDDPLISNILIKGSNEQNITWREVISFAINYWMFVIQKDCNNLENCTITEEIAKSESNENVKDSVGQKKEPTYKDIEVTQWNNNDFDCKLPVYHMAQITLRIFHHDYYIAAGAPWRMNVMIGDREFQSVKQRITHFSKDPYTGGVTIVYAFQLLFEMFIREDPQTKEIVVNKDYNINTDVLCTRPNSIALATLLIWTYSYTLYGPEALLWDNECDSDSYDMDKDGGVDTVKQGNMDMQTNYIPIEGFDSYIVRMYHCLKIRKTEDVIRYQNEVIQKAVDLKNIPGQNNMVGFVKFIKNILDESYWDLGRELGKLLNNCIQRSLGKKSHICHDMYDV